MIQCPECDQIVTEEIARRAARDDAEATAARLLRSGLPVDYRNGTRTLASLPLVAQQAVVACDLLGSAAQGLYLYGPAGSFKTSVAAAFLASRIRAGQSGLYVAIPDLFADVHASYGAGSTETRTAIVDRLVDAPLLALDEFGKERASEHAAGVIFEVIDGRYRNRRPGRWLIVASNLDLDTACDRFPGEELADPVRRRLSEMTAAVPMERER